MVHTTAIGWPALAILFAGLLLFVGMLLFAGRRDPEQGESRRSARSIIGIVVQMLGFAIVGAGQVRIACRRHPARPCFRRRSYSC